MAYKDLSNHDLFCMVRRGYAWLKWHKPIDQKAYKKDSLYQKMEAGYKLLTNEAWKRGYPEMSLREYNKENTLAIDLSDEELACIFGVMPYKNKVDYRVYY